MVIGIEFSGRYKNQYAGVRIRWQIIGSVTTPIGVKIFMTGDPVKDFTDAIQEAQRIIEKSTDNVPIMYSSTCDEFIGSSDTYCWRTNEDGIVVIST